MRPSIACFIPNRSRCLAGLPLPDWSASSGTKLSPCSASGSDARSSAALIADGYHARVDGLTSLAVVAGALGVWLGFPLADPIIGLLITIAIFGIVWQSARSVLTRMLDGVEPGVVKEVVHAGEHVSTIQRLDDV